jgi:hypothetical protein
MNNPISIIKKLLKLKDFPQFANIEQELINGKGKFRFFFIQTNSQNKIQVFFKPKRVHLLKNNNKDTRPIECLMKDCPACEYSRSSKNIDFQFKSRFLYHIATEDQRFLLLDVGSNLHSSIMELKRICDQTHMSLFNNPELLAEITSEDSFYKITGKNLDSHEFNSNIKNFINFDITLYEDKYEKLTKDQILEIINSYDK